MSLADSYAVPKDLPGLCAFMLNLIATTPRHWTPKNPAGPNEADVLIIRGCIEQRLRELDIDVDSKHHS